MIKRLMMFYREDICYDAVNTNIDIMAKEFRKLGVECDIFDIIRDRENAVSQLVENLQKYKYDAAFTCDMIGQQDITIADGLNLYNSLGIPFFNLIVDPPWYHVLKSKCKNTYMFVMDRDHVPFVRKYYPHIRDAVFVQHSAEYDRYGGCDTERYAERTYPVTFIGTHVELKGLSDIIESFPENSRELVWTAINIILDDRSLSTDRGFERALEECKKVPDLGEGLKQLFSMMEYAEHFVRAYCREELIRNLMAAGVPLHIWGKGWDELDEYAGSNAAIYSPVSSHDVPAIYKDSKIVLNVMPWFKNGSNERIAGGMMAGALVCTDHSKFIDELPDIDDMVRFYDISRPQDTAEIIFDCLDDPEGSARSAKKAADYAGKTMTTSSVAETMLAYMNSVV